MPSSTRQLRVYTTKTATATSKFNTPSSEGYRWSLIAYSVLTEKKEHTVQGFFISKKQRSFSADTLRYMTYLKLKPYVAWSIALFLMKNL